MKRIVFTPAEPAVHRGNAGDFPPDATRTVRARLAPWLP